MNEPYVVIRFILKLLCGISVAWIAFVLAFHFLGPAGGWISLAGLVGCTAIAVAHWIPDRTFREVATLWAHWYMRGCGLFVAALIRLLHLPSARVIRVHRIGVDGPSSTRLTDVEYAESERLLRSGLPRHIPPHDRRTSS